MPGKRLLLTLVISVGILAATGPRQISSKAAWKLMGEAMAASGIDPKGFDLVPYVNSYAPDFYSFQALPRGPGAEGSIGFFAVNPWSGYIWNLAGCRQVTSPSLKKEQARILKTSGMSASEAKTLGEKSPGCSPE